MVYGKEPTHLLIRLRQWKKPNDLSGSQTTTSPQPIASAKMNFGTRLIPWFQMTLAQNLLRNKKTVLATGATDTKQSNSLILKKWFFTKNC